MNNSPLCYAAANGHLEIVKYLVNNGADIYAWNNEPFLYAVIRNNHLEIVKYLEGVILKEKRKNVWEKI